MQEMQEMQGIRSAMGHEPGDAIHTGARDDNMKTRPALSASPQCIHQHQAHGPSSQPSILPPPPARARPPRPPGHAPWAMSHG